MSDTIGEFWYKLNMVSEKSEKITTEVVEVELGKTD